MRTLIWLAGPLLALGNILGARTADEPPAEALTRRATLIKPAADELRWQQIPWLIDLAEGQKRARAEGRPILLWVTGDDPLERC
ncbi:MAG TPA: hypothetical protein VFE78_20365 [Gemmataceae bacterium]|nr:hypothetical protein [Gemmataceae bacterium]